jgi:V/A-type H+-transporting ATPase subunit E
MGLEAVVGDIQERGRKAAEEIRGETQREVERILGEAQKRVARIKLTAEEVVKEQTSKLKEQEVSAANLIVKRQQLNAQKELLDQVFETALQEIAKLPDSFHHAALKNLLEDAGREIRTGVVHCNHRDVANVRQLIAGGGSAYAGYRVGDEVPIEGGIVVESTAGDLKIDLSYRTFLDRVWESGLKEASDILFA